MFCPHCGKEIDDNADVCPECGKDLGKNAAPAPTPAPTPAPNPAPAQNTQYNPLQLVAFVLMIITTVSAGIFLIPLAWMIPMDVHLWQQMKNGNKVGIGFGICTLIFVNLISGILLIVDTAQENN